MTKKCLFGEFDFGKRSYHLIPTILVQYFHTINNILFPFPDYRTFVLSHPGSGSLIPWAGRRRFTLGKRSKGCHLVTDEILPQIEAGLDGVQVPDDYAESERNMIIYLIDRNVVLVHVSGWVLSPQS